MACLSLNRVFEILLQIHQKNLGMGQTPPPPFWQCQDFQGAYYGTPSLIALAFRALVATAASHKQLSPRQRQSHCCWPSQHCKQGLHSENSFSLTAPGQRLRSNFLIIFKEKKKKTFTSTNLLMAPKTKIL